MKKVLAVILATTMAAGVATTAFAATDYSNYGVPTIGASGIVNVPVDNNGVPIEPEKPDSGASSAVWAAYRAALDSYKAAIQKYNTIAPSGNTKPIPDVDAIVRDAVKDAVKAGSLAYPEISLSTTSADTWYDYYNNYNTFCANVFGEGNLPTQEPVSPKTSNVASIKSNGNLYNTYLTTMTKWGFRTTSTNDDIFNWQYDGVGNLNVTLTEDSGVVEGEYYFDLEAAGNNREYSITDINKANNQPEDIIWVYDDDTQSIFLIADASADKPEAHVRDGAISISMKTVLKNTTIQAIGNHLGRNMGTTDSDAYTHTVPSSIDNTTSGMQTIQAPVINYTRDGNKYVGTPVTISVPNGKNYVLEDYIDTSTGRIISGGTYAGEGGSFSVELYKDSVVRLPAGSVITVINPAQYFGDNAARGNLTLYEMKVTSQALPYRDLDPEDYTVEIDYKTKVVKVKGQYGYSNSRDVESDERYVINESPRRSFDNTGSVFNFNETLNKEVRIDCQSYVDLYFKGNYGTDFENLRVVTDDIQEVEDFFADYDIDYYDFVGKPKFARDVTCIIDADSEAYIYEFDKDTGDVVDITDDCTYESDGFKFKRKQFKTYVILEEPYEGGNVKTDKEDVATSEPTPTVDPGKTNPGTGAYPEF